MLIVSVRERERVEAALMVIGGLWGVELSQASGSVRTTAASRRATLARHASLYDDIYCALLLQSHRLQAV